MFFAFSMFSICITKITQMFNKINMRRQEFNEHMAHVRSYLHENDVDIDLSDRISGFLDHRFQRRRMFAKELGMFNELSETLRIQIKCAQYGPVLSAIWIFEQLTDQELKWIVPIVSVEDFAPGDILAEQVGRFQVVSSCLVGCFCWALYFLLFTSHRSWNDEERICSTTEQQLSILVWEIHLSMIWLISAGVDVIMDTPLNIEA